jgi:Domain of Unknown Function (DUF1080)
LGWQSNGEAHRSVQVRQAAVALKAGGKWNTYDINARGPKFTVTLNGVRTEGGVKGNKHTSGLIALRRPQIP